MHFILRRVSGQGAEMTKVLGNSYTLITIENSPKEFLCDFKLLFGKEYIDNSDDGNVFGLISDESGESVQPLYRKQENYIMTSDGKTFAKLLGYREKATEKPSQWEYLGHLAKPMTEFPETNEGETESRLVVIDLDGKRKDFVTGYYDHNDKDWVLNGDGLDKVNAKWMDILPIS